MMNWLPGFFAPAAAWLFLLLIPLVAFYFLKLRRPRVTIPSLVLWRQVLNDQRVNSPFQKFKRNLLLLLQILLLVALVLAAMQPFFFGSSSRSLRIPILIDTSASMAALDAPGGTSRLDAVKQRIIETIDNMLPDQQMCLISSSDTARQETVFTDNKRLLKDALEQLHPRDVTSNLEDGLRMAEAVRRSETFETLILYSDGNFPEQAFLDLQFDIDFRKLDTGGPNIGITACSARRADSESWDLFVELRNSANAAANATLTITAADDTQTLASKIVSINPNEPRRLIFRIDGRNATLLQLKLDADGFDALSTDNLAYLRLLQNRPLNVYAPTGMYAVRHALRTLPDAVVFPREDSDIVEPASFDLVISNREDDATIPAAIRCIFGSIPDDLKSVIRLEDEPGEIINWKRDSPLFEHVNLRDIILMDRAVASPGADSVALGELGYRILMEGGGGPLMLEKDEPSSHTIRALFDPDRSTMPYRLAFPIFITNLVNETLLSTGLAETKANPTGVLPAIRFAPATKVTVTGPDGTDQVATANDQGQLTGIVADKAGRYDIRPAGQSEIAIGASLLSPGESTLSSVEQIEFNEAAVAANRDESRNSDKPLWRHLAIAALALLVVEWWYFQRRPYSLAASRRPSKAVVR
ncbi:MAG: BatA and WFA domain-containing protein [Verrucomicrobiae bacterium]|nr:BatA and WFA domain-containing protein [Verrucomicrobiae bacterium]